MSQPIVINIGAIPNDGTGDPLRTAFNDVNLNFANVFASGPVGSNIQIANNIVSTLNTNGNLVLSPNGIGIVQSNVSIVPNLTNVRNLGSATQRWATVYGQYLNISSGTTIAGDLSVAGNLTVSGNIIEMGNIVTDSLTIQLGNTVSNSAGADGAGITVGASDNIATILYNSTDNEWNTNIGISAVGNVSAGNVLTSAQVIANGEIQSGTGFFTGGYLSVNGSTDLANVDVSGNLSAVGNITADFFIGDGSQLTNLPLATNSTVGVVALGNGFTLNASNQVTTSSLYNTNLTQPTQHYALSVDTNGVVILPDQSIINGSTLRAVAGSYAGLTTNDGENSWVWVDASGAYIATQYSESGNSHQWTFDNTGSTIFPTLTTQRGDNPSGTIQGQTLLFGDATQEAIISTPDGNDTYINSQRLVINPGQGNGSGEGGDIYLWAGRGGPTSGSGGDVKIRGGQGMNTSGTGGYIRIEGGDSQQNGYPGYIDITGGRGGTTQGAYVRITGGQGATNGGEAGVIGGYGTDVGGDANITAGYGGTNQGGNVNITGGGSALGLSGYGNINVNAGASQWVFNNTGNLTAPGAISAVGNVTAGNITTGGIANVNSMNISQSIRWDYSGSEIYEDGALVINGPGGILATGNITAQFEFNDGAGNSSGIYSDANSSILYGNTYTIVRSNNAGGGGYRDWTFGVDGNLTLPGNGEISINYANGQPYGGTGSAGAAGNAGDIQINVAGNIGADSTLRYVDNGGEMTLYADYLNAPGIFTSDIYAGDGTPSNITLTTSYGNATWTFDTIGSLTLPGGSRLRPLGANLDIFAGTGSYVNLITSDESTAVGVDGGGGYITTAGGTWDFDTAGNLSAPGNVSAAGNIIGGNIVTSGSGGDITMSGGNITGAGNISAGNVSTTGNITAANFIGNTFSLSQTILPTIQSIIIANTSSEYETSGGTGYANVLVANVIPVIEYGVIVTAGSTVDKYVTGNLANIPGTEKIMISTGTSDQPFTVYSYVTTNAGTYYSGPEVGFSGLCLLKGTMISLADGTYKPIEDINNDDLLLTWDFDLGQYAQARPLWIKRGETGTRYNELTFSDGTILRTFDQHRIFNKQAGAFTYPMSDDTPIGTITVNEHGQEITLVKREIVWNTIEHYNIITDHHINLFANSVLTSCRFNNIYPITDMKFVKDVVLNRNLSEFAEIESRFVSGLRLQEQSFDLTMIEGYVNRLLATEATELIGV